MQERYWKKLTDKRYQLIYINEYYSRCVRLQRAINIFLAITTSGAIAAWAIWKQFPIIWALIIALSQVITAVNIPPQPTVPKMPPVQTPKKKDKI